MLSLGSQIGTFLTAEKDKNVKNELSYCSKIVNIQFWCSGHYYYQLWFGWTVVKKNVYLRPLTSGYFSSDYSIRLLTAKYQQTCCFSNAKRKCSKMYFLISAVSAAYFNMSKRNEPELIRTFTILHTFT